jgi:small subunit ribosomal protein S1
MEEMNKSQEEIQIEPEVSTTEDQVNEEVTTEVAKEVAVAEEGTVVEVEKVEETVVEEVLESMDDFAQELDASLKRVNAGDIVECKIITVNEDEIIVNLGYIADGLIRKEDLHVKNGQAISEVYHLEDILKAEVLTTNDGEGNVLLSLKKADQIIVWDDLEAHYNEKTTFEATITDAVKGGIIADIRGVRAFMPASMISVAYVDDLSAFKGETLKVKVVDFDRDDRKVIISHKEIDQVEREAAKKALLSDLKKDQVFNGTVKKLMNFGAFVDLGGVDGLIHINEMSWKRIKHPSDVMKEGDVVEVYIINVDKKTERISLGLKNIGDNPWQNIHDHFKIGQVYEGEVVRLMNFGAFVRIGDGLEGLVHISEISEDRINQPGDVLTVTDKVKVKVMTIEQEQQKIGLSIKEAKDDETAVELDQYSSNERATTSLESVFKDIFKDLK